MAPSPTSLRFWVSLSCRQAVISEVRLGRAAEIHSSRPRSSVSANQQAMAFVLGTRVVPPVLLLGPAPGTDHRSVQQHDSATRSGDLLQDPPQTRGAGGQQTDGLPDPSGHGGAVYSVAAGQVVGPLVTAQHCQHDGGDPPRGQGPPPRADLPEVAADQVGEPVQGGTRQRQAGGVDKAVRALDGEVLFLHTTQLPPGARRLRRFGAVSRAATGVR